MRARASAGGELPQAPRGRTAPLLTLPPSSEPKYIAIYKRLRALIAEGAWPAGTRLPSSRQLALDLGISRNTAHVAIEQLIAEGWAESNSRCGVFVAEDIRPLPPKDGGERHARIEQDFDALNSPVHLFPIVKWRALQKRLWDEEDPSSLLMLDEPAGASELRHVLARLVCASRGILASEDDIIVTSSVSAAVEIVARATCRDGRSIAVEDPTDPRLAARLRYARVPHTLLEIDEEGVVPPSGNAAAECGALVASVALQYPTGTIMSAARRDALDRFARDHSAWIIERDCDGHMAFAGGRPVPPLRASTAEQVIYVRGLDRLVFPGLSLAFILAPRQLVPALMNEREQVDGRLGRLDQLVLARFISEGVLASHLRATRPVLRERWEAVRALLRPQLGSAFGVIRSTGCAASLSDLRHGADAIQVRFESCGWPVRAFAPAHCPSKAGLLIPFAGLRAGEMGRLSSVLRSAFPLRDPA